MKQLSIKDLENEFDLEQYKEFILKKSIDEFLTNTIVNEIHPITNKISEFINLPDIGSHLVTQRIGYTHHGIYVGNKKVVQYSGFSGETFNTDDIIPLDKQNRSSIEEVSLQSFEQGKGYWVEEHPCPTYSQEQIVERAYDRIGESRYNLLFNNCEHFVNWCIYGVSKSKQINDKLGVVYSVAKPIKIVADVNHLSKHIKLYIEGKINGDKLLNEIGHVSTVSATSFLYGNLGQVTIPIPLIGFAVGSFVGYTISNLLYNSGLFSLPGDATIVKQSKIRRAKIEKISKIIVPLLEDNRKNLEKFINTYFLERNEILTKTFNDLDFAIQENNPNLATKNLLKVNELFNQKLTYKSIEDFKNSIKSKT